MLLSPTELLSVLDSFLVNGSILRRILVVNVLHCPNSPRLQRNDYFLEQDGDDQAFLSRMLQEAGEGKKPVLMCPYTVAKVPGQAYYRIYCSLQRSS